MLDDYSVRCKLALAVAALLLAGGCGTSTLGHRDSSPVVPGAAQAPIADTGTPLNQLPAPLAMLADLQVPALRQAAYVEADLKQDGDDYKTSLPHNRVSVDTVPKLYFEPAWGAPGRTLTDVAYCVYHFTAAGYDRNPQLRIGWSHVPSSSSVWFAGLANWDHNRWDWYAGSVSGNIDLASMDPYLDFTDNLLLIVACIDDGPCMLAQVRLGGLPPVAALTATPEEGAIPLTVDFDASASTAVEGGIVSYHWDFEGDGTYELDSGTDSTVSHQYVTNGARFAQVRVTNSNNAADIDSIRITGVGEWHHTWYLTDYDVLNDLAVDDSGYIYAVGTTYHPDGSSSALLLLRLAPAGNLVWARAWDATGGDEGLAVALPLDGTVLTAGRYSGGAAADVLLQKWSKAGALLWSRHYGGDSTDILADLVVDDNQIYACGTTLSTADFWNYDYFVMSCGGDGLMQWARGRDNHEEEDRATALCTTGDSFSGVEGVALVGTSVSTDGTGAWMVEYAVDGGFTRARELGAPAWHVRPSGILYSRHPMTLVTRYYVAGELSDEERAFIHASDESGVEQYATRVLMPDPVTTGRMCYGGGSDILLCGTWAASTADHGMVFRFDYDTGELLLIRGYNSGTAHSSFNAIDVTQYGAIFGGSTHGAEGSMGVRSDGSSSFGVNWQDAPGQAATLEWTYDSEIAGSVYDITTAYLGNQDIEAGQLSQLFHLPIY
jgi:hypothetical protein